MNNLVWKFVTRTLLSASLLLGFAFSAQAGYLAPGADIPVGSDYVTFGDQKWGSPVVGTGAVVTYSYMPTGTSCAGEFVGCSVTDVSAAGLGAVAGATVKTIIRAAFDAWEAVADLSFVEVADDGAAFNAPTTSGDIRIGAHAFDGPGSVLAHAFFPPPNGLSAAGDLHFDVSEPWKDGFGGAGFDIFQVAAHEIGHSIGLRHTDVPMSLMNPFYTEAFSGPQADDIAGAVYLYGEPDIGPPSVPEPSAGLLLLLGMAGLAGMRLKRA